MKKEFLDHLYELRALVQADIDRLVESSKTNLEELKISDEELGELKTRRSQLGSINDTIQIYLNLHKVD
jgi:hypothetical protein